MNNNSTKTNDATKARNEIKLRGIEIDEPENDETAVTVELQVPIEFYLHGRRTIDEYERIAQEDLRIRAGAIFEHINLLTWLAENRDITKNAFFSITEPLTKFGKGLIELQETIQMSFERYRENQDAPKVEADSDTQRQTDSDTDNRTVCNDSRICRNFAEI